MAPLFEIRSTLPRKTTRPTTVFALGNVRLTGQLEAVLKSPPASGVVGLVGQGTTLDCIRALDVIGTAYNLVWCLGITRVNPPCTGDDLTRSTFTTRPRSGSFWLIFSTMNRSTLIELLAARFAHLTKRDASSAVTTILDAMNEAMARGHRIEVRGFGSFTVTRHAPRTGRNPRSGETVQIPEKRVPRFKPGKALRAEVGQRTGEMARLPS